MLAGKQLIDLFKEVWGCVPFFLEDGGYERILSTLELYFHFSFHSFYNIYTGLKGP